MTTTTNAPAEGKPGLDLSGQGLTAEAIGFTGIPRRTGSPPSSSSPATPGTWPSSAMSRRPSALTGPGQQAAL
jgi:hypothetical protein